jgi:DNA polymerase IV (DinB-like DNA polymerase)
MTVGKMAIRVIMHVDMDHFFSAIEEREHPEYKGKPVVVGADPKEGKGRGVVSTCNYDARKFKVRSGMPISKAWKLCPQAVYLPVNYKLYEQVSSNIMAILRQYADKFEQMGFDEAFLDISSKGSFEEAKKLAQEIKREIHEKEELTCSVGVGPNKLVAKMASEFQKPDGLTVIREEGVKKFLWSLPVDKLWGVGKKTERKLHEMKIKTIGDLANYDPSQLIEKFGAIWGTQFHLLANGIDRSEVVEGWEAKSMSREFTFEEDTSDKNLIYKTLDKLCEQVHNDVKSSHFHFKTVSIKIRYSNFETHTHSKTLPFLTDRLKDIQKICRELIEAFLQPDRKIRLVGAKASKLVSSKKQKTLDQEK